MRNFFFGCCAWELARLSQRMTDIFGLSALYNNTRRQLVKLYVEYTKTNIIYLEWYFICLELPRSSWLGVKLCDFTPSRDYQYVPDMFVGRPLRSLAELQSCRHLVETESCIR